MANAIFGKKSEVPENWVGKKHRHLRWDSNPQPLNTFGVCTPDLEVQCANPLRHGGRYGGEKFRLQSYESGSFHFILFILYTVRIGCRVTGYNDLLGIMIGLTKIKIKTSKRHSKYHYIQCISACSDISDITMGNEKSNHQILHKKYHL